MPTYQYRCSNCGHDLEAVQSFTDDSLVDCPSCGEPALRKVFGNVGVVFKGPGFYRTDSRKDGKPAASSAAAPKDSSAGKDKAPKTGSSKPDASTGASAPKSSGSATGSSSSSGASSGAASG